MHYTLSLFYINSVRPRLCVCVSENNFSTSDASEYRRDRIQMYSYINSTLVWL